MTKTAKLLLAALVLAVSASVIVGIYNDRARLKQVEEQTLQDSGTARVFRAMRTTVMGQMQRAIDSKSAYAPAIAEGQKYAHVADPQFLAMLQTVRNLQHPPAAAATEPVKANSSVADSVTRFCLTAEKMDGIVSCESSFFDQKIALTVNANNPQELCEGTTRLTADVIQKTGKASLQGWRLQIVSPYSNGTPVWACAF